MTPREGDAWGAMLLDALEDRGAMQIIERDDGFIEAAPTDPYFAPFRRWAAHERRASRFIRGRVLDIGCGAGRVALHLEARGQDVVAIDASEGAVEVSRKRGVRDARVVRFEDVADPDLGTFDTFVMYGNNLALLGGVDRAPQLLDNLRRIAPPRARIVGSTLDPYQTAERSHLAYHARNRDRGRMAGELGSGCDIANVRRLGSTSCSRHVTKRASWWPPAAGGSSVTFLKRDRSTSSCLRAATSRDSTHLRQRFAIRPTRRSSCRRSP